MVLQHGHQKQPLQSVWSLETMHPRHNGVCHCKVYLYSTSYKVFHSQNPVFRLLSAELPQLYCPFHPSVPCDSQQCSSYKGYNPWHIQPFVRRVIRKPILSGQLPFPYPSNESASVSDNHKRNRRPAFLFYPSCSYHLTSCPEKKQSQK